MLKHGLFLLAGQFPGMTEGEALAGAVDSAVAADRAGLDSVWFAEHHFITYGVCQSATAEAAAERGLPLLLGLHAEDDERCELVANYARVAADHGHDPGAVEHVPAAVCHIADSRAEAEADLRAAMPAWIRDGVGRYVSISSAPRPRLDAGAYVERLLRMHPIGPPEECVARLRESAERTGIRRMLLMVEGTGDLRRTCETVVRLGAEVAPRLAGGGGPTSPQMSPRIPLGRE